ncbi:MAG: peptidoglycan DD-metalloendopeptidase family protein [Christensenellales bacterium]
MADGLCLSGDARRDDRRHRRHSALHRSSAQSSKRAGRRPRAGDFLLSTPQISPIPVPTLAPIRMPSAAGSVRPVSGRQIRGFSSQPVFWQGLDCWQSHSAVDLAAEAGETAVCMRDGVVLSCVRDELWGWSVEIRQTDESVCTYAGLSCVLVQAGQTVARGQALGDVLARIPAESELGPHMHLSLACDGQWVDPASALPEA